MSTIQITGANAGTALMSILGADDIQPGASPSYDLCKLLYTFHPVGRKMTETPVRKAQSLGRDISVGEGPSDELKKVYDKQWKKDGFDETICQVATLARAYGIASATLLVQGSTPDQPIDLDSLADTEISFNILDPLNTAGSLVLNQNPNDPDFMKHRDIAVNGIRYHRSRAVTIMNEQPVYIEYTTSAYGFVGRSVYQRALFPMKSYISVMLADNFVVRKVGLIVAALKQAGSIVDAIMAAAASFKRQLLKVGQTDNVISIAEGETVTSLDLSNLDGPLEVARKHIIEDIATAADMPSKLLGTEAFVLGFGEGTEDAKSVADYLDGIRKWLDPLYEFFDMICQRRAWNKKFYATLQKTMPEVYAKVSYEEAFYTWQNSFSARWPSLLREPDSEKVQVADVKLKSVIALMQVLLPEMDDENRVKVIQWASDEFSSMKDLFSTPLDLDYDALKNYEPPQPKALEEPEPNKPFAAADALAGYLASRPDGLGMGRRVARIEDHLRRQAK